MRILIKAIGKEKTGALKELIDEYHKRIPWDIKFIESVCSKKLNEAELKEVEGKLLLNELPPSSFKIVLDANGKQMSSWDFAALIRSKRDQGIHSFVFLIGGAHGHGKNVIDKADLILSLGKMTFAHKVVRLLLIEQIYRIYTIINNHPYHK